MVQSARAAADGSAEAGQGSGRGVKGRTRSTEWDRFWAADWDNVGGVDGRGVTRGDGKRREPEEEPEEDKVVAVE